MLDKTFTPAELETRLYGEWERRGFFKRFHDLDEELPTHYDLVTNTDVLAPEAVARLVADTARNS